MPEHYNAAHRVHKILVEAVAQHNSTPTLQVWATIFELPNGNPLFYLVDVAVILRKLHDEISIVKRSMEATDYTEDVYKEVFNKAYASLDLSTPTNPWENYKQHLTEYTVKMVQVFSQILPSEGEPFTDADIDRLSEQLQSLALEVETGSLPDDIKALMLAHIRILQDAIRAYRVVGKKAFVEAFSQTVTSVTINREVMKKNADNNEFQVTWQKIGETWAFIKERTEDMQALLMLYGGVQIIQDGTQVAVHLLGPLLGHK